MDAKSKQLTSTREPLAPALLAQADDIRVGRAIVRCYDGTALEMDAGEAGAGGDWGIVTWRGREWKDGEG